MARLLLFLFLLSALLIGFAALMAALRAAGSRAPAGDPPMLRPFRLIAYGLLLALMLGVSAGWLGAA